MTTEMNPLELTTTEPELSTVTESSTEGEETTESVMTHGQAQWNALPNLVPTVPSDFKKSRLKYKLARLEAENVQHRSNRLSKVELL